MNPLACVFALLAGMGEAPTERSTVVVHIGGESPARDEVRGAIEDRLDDIDVVPEFVSRDAVSLDEVFTPVRSSDPSVVAHVFVLLEDDPKVFVIEPDWSHVLGRRLGATEIDIVALEQISLIVSGSVDALLAGGTIGIAPAEAREAFGAPEPEPETEPAPEPELETEVAPIFLEPPRAVDEVTDADPKRSPRPRASLAAGYGLQAFAPGYGPAQAVTVSASLRGRSGWRWGGAFSGGVLRPPSVAFDTVEVDMLGGTLRGWAGATPTLTPRVAVEAEIGGGVDVLRLRPSGPVGDRVEAVGAVGVRAGPVFSLGRGRDRVRVALLADVAVRVDGFHLTTNAGEEVRPYAVAPGGTVEVGWAR